MKIEDTRPGATPPRRRAGARVKVLIGAATLALAAGTGPAAAAGAGSWYLSQFGMSSVWQTSTGSGIVVADVDTGVNAADGDLSGRVEPEIGLQGGSVKPADGDSSYDGTAVAVLVAGTGAGGSRIQGLAPKASVLPIQIQDVSANGIAGSAAAAIHQAVQHGAKVIVFPKPLPDTSASFEAAVKYAVQHNAIVIAGAGNNGSDAVIGDPCAAPGALCISATTQSGSVAALSSVGPDVTLGAPGAQIPIPTKAGGTTVDSSTHYSAALAAGEAALVWGAHPSWTAGQVIRAMLDTAKQGNSQHTRVNDSLGYGIIDPAAAIAASTPPQITNPLLPVVPTSSASKSATTQGHATAATGSSGSFPWLWVVVGLAAVVLVGAIGTLVLRGRPRRRNYVSDSAYLPPTHQVEPQSSWPPNQVWPQPDQSPYPGQFAGTPQGTPPHGAPGWAQPVEPQQSPLPWPAGQAPQQSPLPWQQPQAPQEPQQAPSPWPPSPSAPAPGGEATRQD